MEYKSIVEKNYIQIWKKACAKPPLFYCIWHHERQLKRRITLNVQNVLDDFINDQLPGTRLYI